MGRDAASRPGKQSAGILAFRHRDTRLEVLLVHPGGPFWAKKDDGAWSIPKGELASEEEPLACARREFAEELGAPLPNALEEFLPLGTVRQSGGKLVHAWAVAGDLDPAAIHSNSFTLEWPPRSGRMCEFPEIDRAAWYPVETARVKILVGQLPFLDRLLSLMVDCGGAGNPGGGRPENGPHSIV